MKESKDFDTIVALATAPGRGAIAIVRLSGPEALSIFNQLSLNKISLQDRSVKVGYLYHQDRTKIDYAVSIFFKGPQSFTGDDVVELQLHASDVVVQQIINYCCILGARLAEPGEFSKRAYLNGKKSLTELEAIADLIAANNEAEAKAAMRTMQGDFAEQVTSISKQIMHLRMMLEAHMDFTDEDISPDEINDLEKLAIKTVHNLDELIVQAGQGSILKEGLQVAIVGKPNVGKSSLMNALAKEQRSIVSDIAGTTRDMIREHLMLGPLKLHLIDTAGLCETDNIIEQKGIEMAKDMMQQADIVWYMIDSNNWQESNYKNDLEDIQKLLSNNAKLVLIINKIDQQSLNAQFDNKGDLPKVFLSAKQKLGLEELEDCMKQLAGYQSNVSTLLIKDRHFQNLKLAQTYLTQGFQQFSDHQALELFSDDCAKAQQALEPINGKVTSDDVLGEIFSTFCIGK